MTTKRDKPVAAPSTRQKMAVWTFAQAELIQEIVATAERIAVARSSGGTPIYKTDPLWSLLRALERSQYCCAIADAARLLGVSRQRAHLIARSAERLGLLELLPNPDDRRIVQLFLTRSARDELAAARSEEGTWIATLLLGLDPHRLSATTHVLRVIRQRLRRAERELTHQ
jgi:DNA-binding MarR family transcriptional regulator